jgi:hypothetical protein
MKVAVVLVVRDWEALNEAYGFDHAFHVMGPLKLAEPYRVLIAEGFDKVPPELIGHWRERGVEIEDAAATFASLLQDYPWLQALPDNPTYRVTLLRHLILQRHFGGEAVLSADADIVWRMDPYRLFGDWKGGYFAAEDSGFLTYASAPEWFEAYRLGLHSTLTGGALTADFRETKFGISRVLHDQHLLRHLEAKGLIRNEWAACRVTPALKDLALLANPLHPKMALAQPPERVKLERRDGEEALNGAPIAFWHMQSSFVGLCSFHYIVRSLTTGQGGRLPFPRPKAGRDNLKAELLHQFRELIIAGQISDERFSRLRPMMFRRGIYKAFFRTDLADQIFRDEVWWEPGVFA